eukprot:evm.model.NODE_4411_length_24991_cov_22.225641.6
MRADKGRGGEARHDSSGFQHVFKTWMGGINTASPTETHDPPPPALPSSVCSKGKGGTAAKNASIKADHAGPFPCSGQRAS